jgi:hypothetical protein
MTVEDVKAGIDRREAIRRAALIMGMSISAPAVMGILNGCTPRPELNWQPTLFTEDQAALIMELAETIIPRTDTPGSKDVGVPAFIELMIKDCYAKEDQDRFLAGIGEFEATCEAESGDSFLSLDAEKRLAFAKSQNQKALEQKDGPRPFFLMVKELTLLGFFTSEPGATQVLQYLPVPGQYKGCIPLSEAGNGKTWAT